MHYRKAKQQVSSHLNTNSHSLCIKKNKNTNSRTLYKTYYY